MVGKSVLILDQNTASRNFLGNTFLEKQFKVTVVASGKEALIIAWRDEPGLILFDPVLSDIKVEEFIQKLRNHSRTNQTPLVALSSDPSPGYKETCLNAGVYEYLVKSAQAIPTLEETLKRLFGTEKPTEVVSRDGEKSGLLIVFISAKGGTGTSSLCANLAMTIKLATVAELPSGQTNAEYFHENLPEPELWQFQLLPGSPDQSTIKLTKTVLDYLQTQGIDDQNIYVILNRAVGPEGLTKAQAEQILGLIIKTAIPYMGSNFALANNLHQPITTKYPTDTASIILKETAENMVRLVRLQRAQLNT